MKKPRPKAARHNRQSDSRQHHSRGHIGAYILIIVSFIAFCLTTWRYFLPESGVTGTGGALLAMFGTFMLIVAGLILSKLNKGFLRIILLVLAWLGVLGTLAALLLLHGWISAFFIVIGIFAIAFESLASLLRRLS